MKELTETNDPKLKSWVDVPPASDFPIQNLPFGVFSPRQGAPRAGVAIGEMIADLSYLHEHGYLDGAGLPQGIFSQPTLNDFLSLGRKKIRHVRTLVSRLLRHDHGALASDVAVRDQAVVKQKQSNMIMPVHVRNYTDFYSSEEHAFNVGSMFRDPKNALLPNWKHLPVGYHGRASSIVISGTDIRRPKGQVKAPDKHHPDFLPTSKLDFELELAFITCAGNKLGHPVTVTGSEEYIAGFVLFNDWSARDIQQWEYVPLGPFRGPP